MQDKLKHEREDLASMRRSCRSTKRENKEMETRLATQERQIEAQMFVMNNLRNGIDYLKEHCAKPEDGRECRLRSDVRITCTVCSACHL